MSQNLDLAAAERWQQLLDEFETLGNEERAQAGPSLRATASPSATPLVDVEQWELHGTSDKIRGHFELIGMQAGLALGTSLPDAENLDFWLHCLRQNVCERATGLRSLAMESQTPSCITIDNVCEESTTFCLSLQRQALAHNADHRTLAEWFSRWIDGNSSTVMPYYPSMPPPLQDWISRVAKRANIPVPIHFLSSRLYVPQEPLESSESYSVRTFLEEIARKHKLTWCITRRGLWMATHPPEDEEYIDALGILHPGRASRIAPSTESGRTLSNREMVDQFIIKILEARGIKIRRADIYRVAGYKNRVDFDRWQKGKLKRGSTPDRNFRRVLSYDPDKFLGLLPPRKA